MIVKTFKWGGDEPEMKTEAGYLPQGSPMAVVQVQLVKSSIEVTVGRVIGWRTVEYWSPGTGDGYDSAPHPPQALVVWFKYDGKVINSYEPTEVIGETVDGQFQTFYCTPEDAEKLAVDPEFIERAANDLKREAAERDARKQAAPKAC